MDQPPTKETRVPVNLRIKFRSETIEQFVERYAVDVSRGGIFIRTREPLAVGTQLKFDFQLQDTSPLMAGEGTVVWIREHDPSRAGVTPGMGVRFDRLTTASQPVLDRILADKARREPSGPNAAAAATATSSGKSGVGPLPARRPSSTFSALDPAGLGVPTTAQPAGGSSSSGATVTAAAQTGATLPFGSVPGAAAGMASTTGSTLKPLVPTASAGSAGSGLRPLPTASAGSAGSGLRPLPTPSAGSAGSGLRPLPTAPTAAVPPAKGGIGSGNAPALEGQSALGRLATGPNLSAFSPLAPRSKSPVPLPPKNALGGDASGPASAGTGTPAVPTPVEDSERTQIADRLPDFGHGDGANPDFANNEPTQVGGQNALDVADVMAGRPATITATSRRSLTPAPGPKLSLDGGVGSGVQPMPTGPAAGASAAAANRTTSPDGSISAGAPVAGRLSAASIPAVGAPTGTGVPGPIDTDLARTVPAEARMSAITSAMRSTTPPASPRIVEKRRPVVAIVVGVLVGAAAAAALVIKLTSGGDAGTPSPTAASAPEPVPAPAAPASPPPAPANPEATAAAPSPGTEPKPTTTTGQAPGAAAKSPEGKAGEPPAPEAKVEAKPAEAKPAEVKPAEPAPAVAEAVAPTRPGRKARPMAHKKGAALGKAEAALEAAAATGGSDEAAAGAAEGGPSGNVARVISLPTGAEVLIDGQSVGKTPFVGKDLDPAAPHALTVRKDGFETYEHMLSSTDWIKGKGTSQMLKVVVKLRKTKGAGETESGADKKTDKAGEPAAAESGKTEPPPAAETP